MVHLPLKGSSEVINEVLSGRVQAAMVSAFSIQPYKGDSRIKWLGTTGPQRSSQFADLPTLAESGFPQFQWSVWAGLLAPAGTLQLGLTYIPMPVSQFDILLREDWRQSSTAIEQMKITLD